MTELEQQLLQALEQQAQAFEQQYTELSEKLNDLANAGEKRAAHKNITSELIEQERGKICLECKHGKYTKRQVGSSRMIWGFKCLIDFEQNESANECTHAER